MYVMDRIGERLDSWEMPVSSVFGAEKTEPTRAEYVLLKRNDCTSLASYGDTCSWRNLYSSPSCPTLSNAFSKSKSTAAVLSSLFVMLAMCLIIFVSCLIVECCGLKAY